MEELKLLPQEGEEYFLSDYNVTILLHIECPYTEEEESVEKGVEAECRQHQGTQESENGTNNLIYILHLSCLRFVYCLYTC